MNLGFIEELNSIKDDLYLETVNMSFENFYKYISPTVVGSKLLKKH